MALTCMCRWHSTSGDEESVEYPFIAFPSGSLWPGVVVFIWIPCMDQIDLFKIYSYSIGLCKKKILKNNYTKI